MMTRLLATSVLIGCALSGASTAGDLIPGSGHSIHLAAFDGVVYYTVEQDGYRVVATLASGTDAVPVRVTATLAPGQRMVLSVPQSLGQPSLDFEILRNGDALVVSDAVPVATIVDGMPNPLASGE